MKTKTILDAIAALDAARQILRGKEASIPEQMALAEECSSAEFRLRAEFLLECQDLNT